MTDRPGKFEPTAEFALAILDHCSDPIFVWGIKNELSYANQAAQRMIDSGFEAAPIADRRRVAFGEAEYDVVTDHCRETNRVFVLLSPSQKLKERIEELEREAATDFLSGLANRRKLKRVFDGKNQSNSCLAVIDVDSFKAINDKQGHVMGDKAICYVALLMKEHFENALCIARLGGDEFAVFTNDLTNETAESKFEEFRSAVAGSEFGGSGGILTVSIGVAVANGETTWDLLMARTDKALHHAKDSGRNRVVVG